MKHQDIEIADEATTTPPKERRYLYNGEPSTPMRESVPRGNRPVKKRKRSPFIIILLLAATSLIIVFYVWNKISVNRLAVEVNDAQMQYQKILYANEVLRAEINKKSSLERIGKISMEQLGLTYPKEQPVWFTVNQEVPTKPVP